LTKKSKKDCCCWESNPAPPANTVHIRRFRLYIRRIYGRPKPIYSHTVTEPVALSIYGTGYTAYRGYGVYTVILFGPTLRIFDGILQKLPYILFWIIYIYIYIWFWLTLIICTCYTHHRGQSKAFRVHAQEYVMKAWTSNKR